MFHVTDRLLLRPIWPGDEPAIQAAVSPWAVAQHLARVPHPYMADDAAWFVRYAASLPRNEAVFAVARRGDPYAKLIGTVGLERTDDNPEPVLGYWFAQEAWGQGFATEAAAAVLEIGFLGLGLASIRSSHHVANPASGRVLDKIGFAETGFGTSPSRSQNALVPTRFVRLTAAAWRAQQVVAALPAAA
jgi:[ribosomal protein S5]-alanine N-acetyltransferase